MSPVCQQFNTRKLESLKSTIIEFTNGASQFDNNVFRFVASWGLLIDKTDFVWIFEILAPRIVMSKYSGENSIGISIKLIALMVNTILMDLIL
jgi:membrane protein insertase Oxa1/YidC/SpoIIIJ